MTTTSLIDELRAAELPSPAVRKGRRLAAGASLRDIAAELARRGVPVTAGMVHRWESGVATPRRAKAIAYRQLLDELEAATR